VVAPNNFTRGGKGFEMIIVKEKTAGMHEYFITNIKITKK
jgi:hypothetical protein